MGQGISGVWSQKVELQEQLDAYSHLSSIWDIQIKHYLQKLASQNLSPAAS